MKKTVLLIGICLMIMSAHAQQTNEERYKQCVEEELKSATNAENASEWVLASHYYSNAVGCIVGLHDWDSAIKYELKAAEMDKKAGRNSASSHTLTAHYYENKGPGFEKEIKEQCDLAEPDILKEIEEKLKEEKTSKIEYKVAYSSIDMWYSDLATCYKRAKDMEKSCSYCIKSNEYGKKSGSKVIYDCSNYGCPKDSSTSSNSLTNVTQTDGNSTIVYMAAAIVLLALIAGLFVLGRKKKEKK